MNFPDTIEFEITQDHISNCPRGNSRDCMAAQALKDHFQDQSLEVSVLPNDIMIDRQMFVTSPELEEAIDNFDLCNGRSVKPGQYILTRENNVKR